MISPHCALCKWLGDISCILPRLSKHGVNQVLACSSVKFWQVLPIGLVAVGRIKFKVKKGFDFFQESGKK